MKRSPLSAKKTMTDIQEVCIREIYKPPKGRSSQSKRSAVNPPPITSQVGKTTQLDSESPSDEFFSSKLIGFLIVNFSLLSVLLAAGILLALKSSKMQLTWHLDRKEYSRRNSVEAGVDVFRLKTNESNKAVANELGHATQETPASAEGNPEIGKPSLDLNAKTAGRTITASRKDSKGKRFLSEIALKLRRLAETMDNPTSEVKSKDRSEDQHGSEQQEDNEPEILMVSTSSPQRKQVVKNESLQDACQPDAQIDPTQAKPQIDAPFYGTKIEWNRLVDQAASQASSEDKLVFLMHVSGNFTKEEFT